MGVKYKLGDSLKQVMPAPVTGIVTDISINTNDIQYTIMYTDDAGHDHEMHFTEDQVEAI
jgi:uncharacterized protein (UPF0303 family)